MKILVTGAAGFIGKPLCSKLILNCYQVIPVLRNSKDGINNKILFEEVLKNTDVLIHLAGITDYQKNRNLNLEEIFQKENVDTAEKWAMSAAQAGVKRFIFLSTIKVYGECTPSGECFNSDSIPNPQSEYAKSKWRAENKLNIISRNTGLDVVIIRTPIVYGPGVKGNFQNLIRLVKLGIPLPFGSIKNYRSMIALDNLLSFILLCTNLTQSQNAKNKIFLVSDGLAISTPELLDKISLAYSTKTKIFNAPISLLKFILFILGKKSSITRLTESLLIDDTKTYNTLGWIPEVSIDQQLKTMANDSSN